ncbi:MarR family winged helix-turn-helix transcriptional regulator [Solirhodobacter olei]|uniref:MarR family winged helix-turn-helix transcriptional regulator n=1 Tax=Solirhodobacter olei TaxID=2493082 RepID=UPI000FDCAB0D|nr:MarR family winged helix-turn-helix transcriptional regulator [Solirhodobacter olei]
MSSNPCDNDLPPVQIGALLRWALHEIRDRIYSGVVEAGFDDVRPPHVTLFRWPGPDGRRPTEVGADVRISKQRINDLLRDLERLGYLALETDPTDSRARLIRLTERGHRLHQTAIGAHAAVEAEWAARVGHRRYEALRDTLIELMPVSHSG